MVNGLAPVYGWFREGFDTFDPRLGVIRVEFRLAPWRPSGRAAAGEAVPGNIGREDGRRRIGRILCFIRLAPPRRYWSHFSSWTGVSCVDFIGLPSWLMALLFA
jgi:hypothetical protein